MRSPWPEGFARVPDEEWTRADLDGLALKYDTVENHGWYRNLEPTLDELAAYLTDGMRLVSWQSRLIATASSGLAMQNRQP